MKPSFLGQDRNETAGNRFFVHNSEPDFSPQIFSMFFRSCVFPFSVLAFFFFFCNPDICRGFVYFYFNKTYSRNLESQLSNEQEKERDVSSYRFVPAVPVSISPRSSNNSDSDHLCDFDCRNWGDSWPDSVVSG